MLTLQLHQQGLSIPEIAKERDFSVSTINNHLSELMEMNQPVALNKLVPADKQQEIIKVIEAVGELSLKTIKEALGDDYSYAEIRLVRGCWRSHN